MDVDSDDGMLRMPLMGHLEELRARIIRALYGFGAIFVLCLFYSEKLFNIAMAPGRAALQRTGIPGAEFVALTVMEKFQIIWVQVPVVASLFLGAPWILWQVWAFISPGLYKQEKKWAVPFVLSAAGLFILGGLFGYFIALSNGMSFLLGIGKDDQVVPLISIASYFDVFVDLLLGIGVAFELPVLMFFLTLIRVVSPGFLLRNSRYAIITIVTIAAIVTPTPDAFNLMLFAVPMCMLFFLGTFLSYLLVLKREQRRFPWKILFMWLAIAAVLALVGLAVAVVGYHYHLSWRWPFMVK
jgi:sec-independent protein translocase protein TatC